MTLAWLPQSPSDPLLAALERFVQLAEGETKRAQAPYPQYANDPVGFFRNVLGIEPWDRHAGLPPEQGSQVDILEAIRDTDKVAVRSGHKVSKALAIDTPVPTPSGWTTMGDIRVGDVVFDEHGKPCRVVDATPVMYGHVCYDVVFSDGTVVTADEGHLWMTWTAQARRAHLRARCPRTGPAVVTTACIRDSIQSKSRGRNHAIKTCAPIECAEAELPLDPYVLGVWLGDGSSGSPELTSADQGILDELRLAGVDVGEPRGKKGAAALYSILEYRGRRMRSVLRELGVLGNKHVPAAYLRASPRQRLALLQGLLDTDGCAKTNGSVMFCNTNRALSEAVYELAASLGHKPFISERRATLNGVDHGPVWCVHFTPHSPVFRLSRKLARQHTGKTKSTWVSQREVVDVRPRESVPVRCISVDSPNHLFLCSRAFIPTHNSLSAAGIALWWVNTQTDARVTLTAPAAHQVESILWTELRLLHTGKHPAARNPKQLPGKLNFDPRAGLVLGDGWGVWGLTTNEPERMSGKSGSRQLYIVDEASGYPEEIYTSVFGNLAGGGKVLLISNPTRTAGTFYDIFHDKGSGWKRIWISSKNTPNFHGGHVDGLADPKWEEWAREHWGGPGAPLYDMRVDGRFPSQADNAVVPLDLVEAAMARRVEVDESSDLDLGVDVAREGDDESIIAPVRGQVALPVIAVKLDRSPSAIPLGHQVGEAVIRAARTLRGGAKRIRIKVDVIGVGASVVDYLLAKRDEIVPDAHVEVLPVNVGGGADKELIVVPSVDGKPAMTANDTYRNLRAQVWFGVRDWLRKGGALSHDERMRGELVAPTFRYIDRGKIAVQEKSELKKIIKRSPDRADALGLALYNPPVRVVPRGVGTSPLGFF